MSGHGTKFEDGTRLLTRFAAVAACAYVLYFAAYRPSYFTDTRFLGALIFLEVLLLCVWEFRKRFFVILIIAFVWAGAWVPFAEQWEMGRWVVLGAGAIAGCFAYLRQRNQIFRPIHLVGLCCILTAAVSALVSVSPLVAMLKTGSLLLLFVFAATGARFAIVGREREFFSGLIIACEVVVSVTALSYFLLRWSFWGNPNSLGLVMSVVVIPILLWGFLTSLTFSQRWRRGAALALAFFLLFSSYERAGLAAAAVACLLLCVGLGKYRLLLKGASFALMAAVLVSATVPLQVTPSPGAGNSSFVSRFLYKGKPEGGILGSRKTVWEETVSTLRRHPWFGTGFGTTNSGFEGKDVSMTASIIGLTHEDGNSYLAITEWTGLLGVVPFLMLIGFVVFNITRVFRAMRRSRNAFCYAVPIAGVLAAGLTNAAFEDWLFAVGYYACIFFWALAFTLPDLIPAVLPVTASPGHSIDWLGTYDRRTLTNAVLGNPATITGD